MESAYPFIGIVKFVGYDDQRLLFQVTHEENVGINTWHHFDDSAPDLLVLIEILFLAADQLLFFLFEPDHVVCQSIATG